MEKPNTNTQEGKNLVNVEGQVQEFQTPNTLRNKVTASVRFLAAAGLATAMGYFVINTHSIEAQQPLVPTVQPITLPDGRTVYVITYDNPGGSVTQVNNQVVDVRVGPDGRVYVNGNEVNNNENNNSNNSNNNENDNNRDNREHDNDSGDNYSDNDGDNNGDNGDNH